MESSIIRFREDVILRTALDQTLDMLGDDNKKRLLYTTGISADNTGEQSTVRDKDGYLDYDKVVLALRNIFGNAAAQLILELVNKKIAELKSKQN